MKYSINLFAIIISMLVVACGGSTSDPKTLGAQDLAPPGYVVSVTKSGEIELRWIASNAEDDFKGFYVFGTTATYATLLSGAKYPEAGLDLNQIGIPRCESNSEFFNAFGFGESDGDCEGTLKVASAEEFTDSSMKFFAEEDEEEDEDSFKNFLKCTEGEDSDVISVAKTGDEDAIDTGLKTCTVTQAYNTETEELEDLVDGTQYNFIVVAVQGDDRDEISWTSNVVTDTPSPTAYTSSTYTITEDEMTIINFDIEDFGEATAVTLTDAQDDCTGTMCRIAGTNSHTGYDDGIYITRDEGSATYEQRVFVSTSATSNIRLLPRGPNSHDETSDTPTPRAPGDTAIAHESGANSPYMPEGTVLTAYANKVFDFVHIDGTDYRYGKLYIGQIDYAGDVNTGVATLDITIITQPNVGDIHYFQ